MRQLTSATLSNQNISAYLLAATYAADADRAILIRLVLDQVAGGGDYLAYITVQEAGAGSAYMFGPITTYTVPAAVTAIGFPSILVPVNNGDVVKVYVKGLAGDTTTPDIITRIFELTYLRPTTAGATLDVAATGEAGVDLSNIKAASAPTTLTNITVPIVATVTDLAAIFSGITSLPKWLRGLFRKDAMDATAKSEINTGGGTFSELTDSLEANRDNAGTAGAGLTALGDTRIANLDAAVSSRLASVNYTAPPSTTDINTALSTAHGSGAWGGAGGSGSNTFVYTLTNAVGGSAIPGADVWATSDLAGNSLVASGITNAAGQVTFLLDPGTYYFWRQLSGWNFQNPDQEVVS